MTIIRVATRSLATAKDADRELRAKGYQSAPSGIHVSTDAPRKVVSEVLRAIQRTVEKQTPSSYPISSKDESRTDYDCGHKLDHSVRCGPLVMCRKCNCFRLPKEKANG